MAPRLPERAEPHLAVAALVTAPVPAGAAETARCGGNLHAHGEQKCQKHSVLCESRNTQTDCGEMSPRDGGKPEACFT